MPSTPYTDDDVLRAATRTYRTLINRADAAAADHGLAMQDRWPWVPVDSAEHKQLCERVLGLVLDGPNLAQWAIELSSAELTHTDAYAWGRTGGLDVAVQIAAHKRLTPAVRGELMTAVKAAVEGVYERLLGQVPQRHIPDSAK